MASDEKDGALLPIGSESGIPDIKQLGLHKLNIEMSTPGMFQNFVPTKIYRTWRSEPDMPVPGRSEPY